VERHGLAGEEAIFVEEIDLKDESKAVAWGLMRSIDGDKQKGYFCHPLDLRKLPSLQTLESIPGLRNDITTIVISECCLCYLEVDVATDVIKWFGDKIPNLGIILYEPIGVDDSFGQMMVQNLAARGIVMPTVQKYKTLAHQMERLAELGFKKQEQGGGSSAETIEDIWRTWIPVEEIQRVDGLEGLDEVEEWQMLARHYSVAWGWKGSLSWGRSHPSR
jgi:[phosphatase 2A protein]-leucine-carboxy methyltransferase